MTNDDKALVERLFAMADEYDSGHHESWPTIDALEIAAHRIEALSAEVERLQRSAEYWEADAKRYAANQEYWRMEERAAIVAWLLKDIGPWLRDEREEYAVEFAAAIEAGEHLK